MFPQLARPFVDPAAGSGGYTGRAAPQGPQPRRRLGLVRFVSPPTADACHAAIAINVAFSCERTEALSLKSN
jgi:hypothetical protein